MTAMVRVPQHRSIRLKGFDYASHGAYFVTMCTRKHTGLFGSITAGAMEMNDAGLMVATAWRELPRFYPCTAIDQFQIMPNHMHGIVFFVGAGPRACPDQDGQPRGVAPTEEMTLGDIIQRFKTITTKRYVDGVKSGSWPRFQDRPWQRNYHEHIIRNERELDAIRRYIADNPGAWERDRENPQGRPAADQRAPWEPEITLAQ